ncbi:ABC transporter ATP-binding protein [Aeromicrobium wangtongii]|uniref:ABC transporter ATP-binding protein n=1 Tax=Aeromicrobium wangtongii TaxID=2969247 RepID=UPI002017E926|nr:ABC transporter ATP-binding protein [Aeromicrobium wangtongii]MCL3816958.1 ABC transporter ATP-binding protein [Aeromicrobium wangtongii]
MNHDHAVRAGSGHGLDIEGVSKRYPGAATSAVNDATLHVAPGEFLTLLGPSGSGKSTLLSMIAGFTSPDSGSIAVNGEQINGLKPHKRNLGIVFQQYALFPHMTVAKNVAYPLRQRGTSPAQVDAKVREVLEMVRLGHLADRLPTQLSGGEQQRVALARAVVYEPRVLLLDEPLSALDKKLRTELQAGISRMHKMLGMTFVFVTHDQDEALSLSDRIAVFNAGHIEQVGTPRELYEEPASLFVAEFLGESNTLAGTADADVFVTSGARLRLTPRQAERQLSESTLIVRPERLTVQPSTAQVTAGHNQVPAVVESIVYAGDHSRIILKLAGDSEGSALLPASKPLDVRPGEAVIASWNPEHQVVVPH